MEKTNFSGSLNLTVVKTAAKPSNAIEPGIELTATVNKFCINRLATPLLDVQAGDTISILKNEDSSDLDNKYFVCKGFRTANDEKDGISAVLGGESGKGKDLDFNLAGIYSEILQNAVNGNTDSVEIPINRLRQLGLMEGKTALKKVYAKIESIGIVQIGEEEREVFRLHDFMVTSHKPRKIKE